MIVVVIVLFKFTKKQIEQNDDNVGYHLAKLFLKKIQTRGWFFFFTQLFKNPNKGNGCHCLAQVFKIRKEKQDNNNHCYHCLTSGFKKPKSMMTMMET
jgi:hypothetical protein